MVLFKIMRAVMMGILMVEMAVMLGALRKFVAMAPYRSISESNVMMEIPKEAMAVMNLASLKSALMGSFKLVRNVTMVTEFQVMAVI